MQPTSSFSPTRIRGPWLLGSLGVAASLLLAGCDSAGFDMSGAQCEGILPGDLVITELLANPEGSDDGQEWFEVHNASEQSLDLDGLVLVTSKADGSGEKSVQVRDLTLPFDGYLVFGAGDPEAPRAFVDQVYPASLGNLRNSDGRIALRCGDRIVDEVLYARSPDGASLAFDGGRAPDAIGNDDEQLWCSDEVDGQSSQPGSPGAPNPPCAGVAATPGGTQDGMCSEGGLRREARTPAMGDLRISELHADPAAVGDAEGEWFELQVLRDLDLNGLQVSRAVDEVGLDIAGEDCRGVSSGDRLLFARSQDSAVNGGLPTPDFLFEFLLTNSDGQLLLIHGGAVWSR